MGVVHPVKPFLDADSTGVSLDTHECRLEYLSLPVTNWELAERALLGEWLLVRLPTVDAAIPVPETLDVVLWKAPANLLRFTPVQDRVMGGRVCDCQRTNRPTPSFNNAVFAHLIPSSTKR